MEKNFYLPGQLKDKFPKKVDGLMNELTINFDDFIYETGMIPVNYEYQLDDDDVNFLLGLVAESVGLKADGEKLKTFLERLDDEFIGILSDYIEYPKPSEQPIIEKLKEYCKAKAFEEFRKAFSYWVDKEEMDDYFEIEDFE